jgi:hypothetical protein
VSNIAVVCPTLDVELHEVHVQEAVDRGGVERFWLYMMQDGEPRQRYTRIVNRGIRLAFADEGARYIDDPDYTPPWDYICLMNDDTAPVTDNWLAELVWCMGRDDKIGYVAPGQPCRTEGMPREVTPEYPTSTPEVRDIFAVPFGCVLIRREVFTDVGLLDPTFVHYCSDTDHQFRARAFGWRSVWAPHIWVDRESHPPKLMDLWYRDRALFYERWPPPEAPRRGHYIDVAKLIEKYPGLSA